MIFNCNECTKEYKRKPSEVKRHNTKYCSALCRDKNRKSTRGSFKKGHIPSKNANKFKKNNKMHLVRIPLKGEKHPLWKGGITKDLNSYYRKYNAKKNEEKAGRLKPEQCELCGAMGRICYDHNHITGKFRGWLCLRCNVALGMVKDNSELLLKMSEYIKLNK